MRRGERDPGDGEYEREAASDGAGQHGRASAARP
jgi:hypothetical protein